MNERDLNGGLLARTIVEIRFCRFFLKIATDDIIRVLWRPLTENRRNIAGRRDNGSGRK